MNVELKIAVCLMGLILICAGCAPISYHRIEKESLIEQIHKSGEKIPEYAPDGYSLAHIKKIRCFNKENEPVYISVDFNTRLDMYTKSRGKVDMLFSTVSLVDGVFYGLWSRLLNGQHRVAIDDIERIELYSEFTREENATD